MKWFRFYDEVLDDPKCQRLTPVMFRHWVNILCIANRSNQRGTLPAVEHIAFSLRLTQAKTMAVLNDLVTVGLLDRNGNETFSPHGWSSRQRVSDDVAQRVSKHRERNESEPLPKQKSNVTDALPHARATEAETETEAESEGDKSPKPPPPAKAPNYTIEFESFWQAYPSGHGIKKTAFEAWEKLNPDAAMVRAILDGIHGWQQGDKWRGGFVLDAHRWLKSRAWESIPPPMTASLTVHRGGRSPTNGYVNEFDEYMAEHFGDTQHPEEDDVIDVKARVTG